MMASVSVRSAVAPALADDDLARFGVEADHADVQSRFVEQHPYFGAFARRRPLNRSVCVNVEYGSTASHASR